MGSQAMPRLACLINLHYASSAEVTQHVLYDAPCVTRQVSHEVGLAGLSAGFEKGFCQLVGDTCSSHTLNLEISKGGAQVQEPCLTFT